MAENSKIEWTHHTMNFWVGCTALSPACDHCYAEAWAKRTGHPELWQGERRRTTGENWQKPLKWDRRCAALGIRERVFTNSLADFLDNQVPGRWRDDAWHRIDQCRNMDWMILSKRPENGPKMLPGLAIGAPEWGDGWSNVWMGTTVEDRARKRRIDALRAIPAKVRFLSIEPLIEDLGELDLTSIDLVIVGGESGPHARPMHPGWARSIRDQCAAASVPFHFKQNGEWIDEQEATNRHLAPGPEMFDRYGSPKGPKWHPYEASDRNGGAMIRVGKARAGRLLDGVEHNGMPSSHAPMQPLLPGPGDGT